MSIRGPGVLINRQDIRDAALLARFERMETANRLETLPVAIPLTSGGFRSIHRHIFQNVYDWAGRDRTVGIAKGDSLFCLPRFIAAELDKRFAAIKAVRYLRGLTAAQFSEQAAEHISELNAIHPFREGNGRTVRAFLVVLAEQAGHRVEPQRIAPAAWLDASRESFRTGDCKLMCAVIAGAIA